MINCKNALVSVSDKTGLVDFLKPLVAKGLRVLSTGGTAQHLREHGIKVVDVSEQTGFPEVMDGRVKTLHPRIHMALLARGDHEGDLQILKEQGLDPIDLLIVNLYPFAEQRKKTTEEKKLIEYIDVGGPSMLRAAAKNFSRITVVCDPADYDSLLKSEPDDLNLRRYLAAKVFSHVSGYDSLIAQTLGLPWGSPTWSMAGVLQQQLRYGENPHQEALWYRLADSSCGVHEAQIIQGKELSYNNLLDLDAATVLAQDFARPAAVVVKHNNPCGVAVADTIEEALQKALQADPVSAFGGIVACNRELNEAAANLTQAVFLECVVAPVFSEGALGAFSKKKNLRVLAWPNMKNLSRSYRVRSISGGMLLQTFDVSDNWDSNWQVIGTTPDSAVQRDLLFAWQVVARLKSNAIAIVGRETSVGLGMGQVNRVDAVAQAISRWQTHHADLKSVVLASDAFFPFADSIEILAKAGIKWVIQPGGSVRDEEVKQKARDLGVNLVLTGRRHFAH